MSRDRLIELVEDGMVDPMMALQMCAAWMTDADVAEMLDANELSERFDPVDEDEEEWEQEEDEEEFDSSPTGL